MVSLWIAILLFPESGHPSSPGRFEFSVPLLIGIVTTWIYGRVYYSIRNGILQIRTPYLVLKTLVLQDIIKADYYASAKLHFLHGWYNVCLTDQKGKKYYLYVKNEKRFLELLKEKNPTLSVVM
mgnify:FL=1